MSESLECVWRIVITGAGVGAGDVFLLTGGRRRRHSFPRKVRHGAGRKGVQDDGAGGSYWWARVSRNLQQVRRIHRVPSEHLRPRAERVEHAGAVGDGELAPVKAQPLRGADPAHF